MEAKGLESIVKATCFIDGTKFVSAMASFGRRTVWNRVISVVVLMILMVTLRTDYHGGIKLPDAALNLVGQRTRFIIKLDLMSRLSPNMKLAHS